jgi:hypothetical protein
MKDAAFWDVALRAFCMNRRFGGTLVLTRGIRCPNPDHCILHSYRRENVKFYMKLLLVAGTII